MAQPTKFAAGDRAVGLVIRHRRIVLIQRIKHGREYYVLPGGGVEAGETPAAACMREVLEETGLVITTPSYLCTVVNQARAEHYFLGAAMRDGLALGEPERERYTSCNLYTPMWVDRAQIPTLNLQPDHVCQLILRHL